jgi:hypothetical protein
MGLALFTDPGTVACAETVLYWRFAALDPLGLVRASSGIPFLEQAGGSGRVASSGVAPFWVRTVPSSRLEDTQLRIGLVTLEVPRALC